MSDSLEARLQRLEDLDAIHLLLMSYRAALDAKDIRGYAELFAAEGEFIAGTMRAKGPQEIFDLVEGMRGTLLTDRGGDDIHVVANPEIEVDGDRASARSTWIYVVRGEGDVPLLTKVGHYDDQLTKEAGTWKFLRREAPTDIPAI
jgi:3-phenylpropionate/cinnamic acid dioxygenase small subunit